MAIWGGSRLAASISPSTSAFEARAEAADIGRLDVFERQVLLEPVRHVEMAAGSHADGDRNVLEVFGLVDRRIRTHENRPRRHPVPVGDEPAHAGARIAHAPPGTGALDHFLALGVRPVLRPLKIIEILPAGLGSAEDLPVELDVESLLRKVTLLVGDEIVQAHAFRGDLDAGKACGHGRSSFESHCSSETVPGGPAACKSGLLRACRLIYI